MIAQSDRLTYVHSDIRGPLYVEALRMQAAGTPVLKLNTGNPGNFGFQLPDSVRNALLEQVDKAVPYCDVRGMVQARQAIRNYHVSRGLQGVTLEDIYICNGVSEAVSMLMTALVGTGDEVLVPSPCYSLWSNNTYLGGGKPVHYRCAPENDWNPDLEDIRSKITSRTKAILVINPNNPTGAAYHRSQLKEWVDYALANEAVILFDSAYEAFITDPELPRSIFAVEGAKKCAIEFCSLSKTAGFTGLRLAYTVIPKELKCGDVQLHALWARRHGTKYNGAPYIIQRAGEAVYSEPPRAESFRYSKE